MTKHSVSDDGDPQKYYAQIPNLIYDLGLNVYEIAIYCYFKRVAGDTGTCWKSTATIAKALKIGAGTVSRTKASLSKPRSELGGKALITITTEMQNGGNENHEIRITDIWPDNMNQLSKVRASKVTRSTLERAHSTGEGDAFHRGTKEESFKKNPEEEETRGYPFDHYAVVEYTQTLMPEPPLAVFQAEVIANTIGDSELERALWSKVLLMFKGNGHQPRYAGNAVDRFKNELRAIRDGKKDPPLPPRRQMTIKQQMEEGLL